MILKTIKYTFCSIFCVFSTILTKFSFRSLLFRNKLNTQVDKMQIFNFLILTTLYWLYEFFFQTMCEIDILLIKNWNQILKDGMTDYCSWRNYLLPCNFLRFGFKKRQSDLIHFFYHASWNRGPIKHSHPTERE